LLYSAVAPYMDISGVPTATQSLAAGVEYRRGHLEALK